MQELTRYLLEFWSADEPSLEQRYLDASKVVRDWLQDTKQGEAHGGTGSFISRSDKEPGRLVAERLSANSGFVDHYRLEEASLDGFLIATDLFLMVTPASVKVFATVSAEDIQDDQRRPATPRCPGAVRRLLARFPDWTSGGRALGQGRLTRLSASDTDVALLVGLVEETTRSQAVLLVSMRDGELAIPDIDVKLANDLAGLAMVYCLEEAASEHLTARVGRLRSCFGGAVRLYGPSELVADGSSGYVWLGSPLSMTPAPVFLELVRRKVMFMATLLTQEPPELSAIRAAAADLPLSPVRPPTIDGENAVGLAAPAAGRYLRQALELVRKGAVSRETLAGLVAVPAPGPAEPLSQACRDRKSSRASGQNAVEDAPKPGEIRHYKKLFSNGAADTMVSVQGCNHNAWQASHSADKARKGIAKLEGRSDWRGLLHCARCTGGGMWRVRW